MKKLYIFSPNIIKYVLVTVIVLMILIVIKGFIFSLEFRMFSTEILMMAIASIYFTVYFFLAYFKKLVVKRFKRWQEAIFTIVSMISSCFFFTLAIYFIFYNTEGKIL